MLVSDQMSTLLVSADRALTGDGARGPTSVLSVDGLIVAVGDPAEVAGFAGAAGAKRLDWSHRAIVPGTVNTPPHTPPPAPAPPRPPPPAPLPPRSLPCSSPAVPASLLLYGVFVGVYRAG